jgi:SH3-like domain-containing protein
MVCLLAACGSEPERARVIGEAFVGPAALPMRTDLSARSETVAALKHGEKVDILAVRRRFVKVRNMGGNEGWLDGRNLLSTHQMKQVRQTSEYARQLPSQGRATVEEALNAHTEPNRQAPSPFQIASGGSVDVVARTVAPRAAYQPIALLLLNTPRPSPPRKPRKKTKAGKADPEPKPAHDPDVPLPPMPAAPKPPDDWLELSRNVLPEARPVIRSDDWSLVRAPDGKAGWMLTRMLIMAIPDEVAQYAEGKRITSYFSLGEVKDEDQTKHHWLWTTASQSLQPHDYDGFRVFVYNTRRHRYETAYHENNIRGFYPVTTQPVEVTENRKTFSVPGFSVITVDKEGKRWKRNFAFQGYRVRVTGKQPVEPPPAMRSEPNPPTLTNATPALPPQVSFLARLKRLLRL